MAKKIRKTNPVLVQLIRYLKIKSHENNAPIWKDIAERLERSLKNWANVNISRIERYANENEVVIVPGKVLSCGDLSKKITIAAWSFSKKAREKIEKAGGRCISIEQLVEENPEGKNVRIIG